MQKRAILIAGGSLKRLPTIEAEDLVIAIDSGLDHSLAGNIIPKLAIGDFDSASPRALAWAKDQGVELVPYPPAKDQTDTQLAVEHALALGAERIYLYGGLGTRIDHSLANMQLLFLIASKGAWAVVTDGVQRVYLLQEHLELQPEAGFSFSILPLTLTVEGLTIRGARYPLQDATIELGDTRTISNEFQNRPVELSLQRGAALVFLYPQDL